MNNQTSDTTKGLLNLGLIGATIYGGVKIIDKIFGDKVRKNPMDYFYVARISEHIKEDIKRNWSSWNYGLEGFEGTEEEFESYLDESREDDEVIFISGFEIFPKDLDGFEFGELYENYWVAIDYRNGKGLSCNILPAETENKAIEQVKSKHFSVNMGDGDTVNCKNAEVVYSDEELHVLKVPEK